MPLLLLLLTAVGTWAFIASRLRKYRSLRHFSGPTLAAWSRLWLLWANGSGKMHLHFSKVNDEHGMTAAANIVSFSSDTRLP